MKKLKFLILVYFLSFNSNVISQDGVLYKIVTDNIPALKSEAQVYLGDRMLVQRKGSFRDCITPKRSYDTRKLGGWSYKIKAGEPLCKQQETDKDYYATYDSVLNGNGEPYPMPIRLSKDKKGLFKLCWRTSGLNSACIKKISEDNFISGETFIYTENSFQQSIEYSGKSGSILTFTYSEYKDNMARDAFTREFQIDLNDGKVAGFKGSIFEIISVDNVQITYKVIRHFQ